MNLKKFNQYITIDLNIFKDGTLQGYINAGMDPSKLNLGLAGYGRATAEPGPYTREGGVLGILLYEFKKKLFLTFVLLI